MSHDALVPETRPATPEQKRRIVRLLAALAAGPTGWILQLVTGYGLASLACFPHDAPLQRSPPSGWNGEHLILLSVNLACLALAAVGGAFAVGLLRLRGEDPAAAGRTHFLAACALLSAIGFALAILFDTPGLLATPACWTIAS